MEKGGGGKELRRRGGGEGGKETGEEEVRGTLSRSLLIMFSVSDLMTLASGGRQFAMASCTCGGWIT